MNRIGFALLGLSGLVLCAGCGTDFYARQIVEQNTDSDRLLRAVTGTGEQLAKRRVIDLHRRFTMSDETPIDVWAIRARPAVAAPTRGTALLLHGLGESKVRYLGAAQNLAKMGYDAVLIDLRAHGDSGGKYVTYGELEKRDVKAVMDSLIDAGAVHPDVCVFGVTLGAATAIQYAAMDARVKAVLALTPYRDAAGVGRRILALAAPMMSNVEFEEVLNRAGEIAAFNPHGASSEAAATVLTCPLLLVHGLVDVSLPVSVPLEHSRAIYAAARGPKRLEVITPGPEQLGLALMLDKWIAERLDSLARTGLSEAPAEPAATTQPVPTTQATGAP